MQSNLSFTGAIQHTVMAIAFTAISHSAIAQESLKDAGTLYQPAFSWSGVYIGAGGGMSSLNNKLSARPGPGVEGEPGAEGASISLDGLGADGHFFMLAAGADYQVNRSFVLGGFVEYTFDDLSTDVNVDIPGIPLSARGNLDVDDSISIGGRFGYLATPQTMLFISGGYTRLGLSDVGVTIAGPDFGLSTSANVQNLFGAFVGGGFETMLTSNISLKGEYRYTSFGSGRVTLPTIEGTDLNEFVSVDVSPVLQTGRASLNYRF